ncbi:FAD-dependent monooxygenase [Occultella kanbiaonis]|uniref:FAD-dependent monooxygenase n=1 Tax=Occultella kanbiaonis TaxID=2675754 RepID=UPI0013D23C6A|nr:FAD-dependent monooxygenase [Occultella kanbiaonis]
MTTILISGAGIAGLTLAHWLRRHGMTPTLVERSASPRDGGYKVDIRGAALDVVERMGLLDDVRAHSTDIGRGTIVDVTGRMVASMDGDTFGGRDHDDAELRRGDLMQLLRGLATEVECRWGDAVVALTDAGDGVDVEFARGDTRRFDYVIGADGVHSATRTLAFDEPDAVHDLGHRVAVVDVPNDLGLDREEVTYVATGRTALVYSTAQSTTATAMFLFADDRPIPADLKGLLQEVYADQGWELPRLLGHIERADEVYLDSLAQVHLNRWSVGRVGLVGDAAYCASTASGQGTSLAIVGAYVLAGELATGGGLAGYERAMREFARRNQALASPNLGRMVLGSARQVRTALTMLSVLGRLPGRDRLAALAIRPIQRAANAIELKEYSSRVAR